MNPTICWAIRWFNEKDGSWTCNWFDNYFYFEKEIKHLIELGYKKENILVYQIDSKLRDEIIGCK